MTRVVAIAVVSLACATVGAAPLTKAEETRMADGDAKFAAQLYAQLRAQPGNLFFSPASVRMALAMVSAGARGETAAELGRVLGMSGDKRAHAPFAQQLADWDALQHFFNPRLMMESTTPEMRKQIEAEMVQKKIVLRVVNRLWAQAGHPFKKDFLAILREQYRAPLAELDLKAAPEPARAKINGWVSDQTEHKIKELIAAGLITAATRLVLTNAIYLKAPWAEQFEPSATREEPFFVARDKQVKAPLMRQVEEHQLATFDGGQLLELPYGYGMLVMDIVLPKAKDGLAALEAQYAAGGLEKWLATRKYTRVDVSLPRFRASSSFSLADALRAIGITHAFDFPGADFSGIDGGHELFISSVVHQAFVEVDERGTEAAAATAVVALAGSAPPSEPPVVFKADHPFLFFIRDPKSHAILFAGRLVDPTVKP
jgi:serpin B